MVILKDINLIPRGIVAKKQQLESGKLTLIILAVLVGLLIITDSLLFLAQRTRTNSIAKQIQTIDQLRGADVNEDVLSTARSKIQYREDIVKKIESGQIQMSAFTDTLEKMVPKDVSLLNLNVDASRKVVIQGKADKEESVLDFYHNLKVSDLSDYIEFSKINGTIGNSSKGFDFTFSFTMKTGSDKK